jgi:hypothetical protein
MVQSTQIARLDGLIPNYALRNQIANLLGQASCWRLRWTTSRWVHCLVKIQRSSCIANSVLQVEGELAEVKSQAKMIFRRLNRNSELQASIESGQYTLQYPLVRIGAQNCVGADIGIAT